MQRGLRAPRPLDKGEQSEHMDAYAAKQQVIDAGHELVKRGLIVRTWGNISCRIDERHFAVTPSGMGYDRLTPADIVTVDCHTLEAAGARKPSGETGIHAAVYRLRPGANFAIHTHQDAASAVSVAGYDRLAPAGDERLVLGGCGSVPRAAYGLPCSTSLCRRVTRVLSGTHANVLFMARHGILALGSDRSEAFLRAETVENMCARVLAPVPQRPGRAFDPQRMIAAIQAARPELACVRFVGDPAILWRAGSMRRLVPMLDDFAQLIGTDIACISPNQPEAAASAIDGRNAVLIHGCGALVAAGEASDVQAIHYLLNKECLTECNAAAYGGAKPLPVADRQTMRGVYVNSYSKLK